MQAIPHTELVLLEGCSHAPIYEHSDEFNERTVDFLRRDAGEETGGAGRRYHRELSPSGLSSAT